MAKKAAVVVPPPPSKMGWRTITKPKLADAAAAPVGTVFWGRDRDMFLICVKLRPRRWTLAIGFGPKDVVKDWQLQVQVPPKSSDLLDDAEVVNSFRRCKPVKVMKALAGALLPLDGLGRQ